MTLFNKILIANRGEIACRIIRTAKRLGIATVAIFSEADVNALHVQLADEAYLIGPAPSKDSYLHIEKIVAVAQQCHVEAIHPGYGFLSENAEFAAACEQAGLTFIGPNSRVIALMANKNVAKQELAAHDIPILPDFYGEAPTIAEVTTHAKEIGLPILLKAVAGGGGKGLRLVEHEHDLEHAYQAVQREAKAFFNDDKILIEKYLPDARHIEVQIMADQQGNIQALATRDCSVQRRHQKIIEEAPAPHLSSHLQANLLQAAKNIAAAIKYTNAGTIEFLVQQDDFYFMEMNTRLQVEHPVTEMITGLDLVEWQIRIAAGQPLFSEAPSPQGHAIEVRINAEDPEKDFLPSSGKLSYLSLPSSTTTRVDSGYGSGDIVDIFYDSLVAKLIVWGETRAQALMRLKQALNDSVIFGVKTTLSLLKNILRTDDFCQGRYNTRFLQTNNISASEHPTPELYCVAAVYLIQQQLRRNSQSPWDDSDGWQLYGLGKRQLQFSPSETVSLQFNAKQFVCQINEQRLEGRLLDWRDINSEIVLLYLLIADTRYTTYLMRQGDKVAIIMQGGYYHINVVQQNTVQHHQEDDERLIAPMPGTLVAQWVTSGQTVSKGDKLIVIEAMKMEHTLFAPRDGIIKQCHYKIGDLVDEGSELLEFE